MSHRYRINELARLTALALDDDSVGQNSGRVREVPDVRTIRYYATLGLVDRPLEMQGRTAFYGPRHLLQLLAVKRLQAQGLSLTAIQHRLAGAEDRTLRDVALLSESRLKDLERRIHNDGHAPQSTTTHSVQPRSAQPFWIQQPRTDPTAGVAARTEPITPAAVLKLGPGVSLLLDGLDAAQLDDQTISQLQPAIAELRRTLQAVGLTATTNQEPSKAEQ